MKLEKYPMKNHKLIWFLLAKMLTFCYITGAHERPLKMDNEIKKVEATSLDDTNNDIQPEDIEALCDKCPAKIVMSDENTLRILLSLPTPTISWKTNMLNWY